jgi:hypothetical protein
MTWLAVVTGFAAAGLAYLQVTVPIAGPSLAHADATQYWPVAVVGGLVVLIVTAAIVWLALRASRRKG